MAELPHEPTLHDRSAHPVLVPRVCADPGNKGRSHFPALQKESGIAYSEMIFWDDCTYGDNCRDVATNCAGVTCVRTPDGLTEALFQAGLDAFAAGKTGVVH